MTQYPAVNFKCYGRPQCQLYLVSLYIFLLIGINTSDLDADLSMTLNGERMIYSGLDFVRAVADTNVNTITVMVDIVLQNEDWVGVATPLVLRRNLTVAGDPDALHDPKIFNMNWVEGKMKLDQGVVFCLQYLVVINYRLGNHNQAPGMDILCPLAPGAVAVVRVMDAVGLHRVCYPPMTQEMSLAYVKRPALIPGNQSYDVYLEQSGCVNDTSAPPLQRCWPHRGFYNDVAMLGADPKDYNRVQLNGYIIHLVRTVYLCDVLLTDACVANLTALGCATYTYAMLNPPWRPMGQGRLPQSEAAAPALPAAPKEPTDQWLAAAGAVKDHSDGLSPATKRSIVAGLVGGLGFVLLIGFAAMMSWRRWRPVERCTGTRPASASCWRRGVLPPWECSRLSALEDLPEAAMRMPASNVTSSTHSVDAGKAGYEAEGGAKVLRSKGKAKSLLAVFSSDGGAFNSVAPPSNPSQRRLSDTCSTQDTPGLAQDLEPAAIPTTFTSAGVASPHPPLLPTPAVSAAGEGRSIVPGKVYSGCDETCEGGAGGAGASGDDDGIDIHGNGSMQKQGFAAGDYERGRAVTSSTVAALPASHLPCSVVTPSTPHRPDVNLQLVLRGQERYPKAQQQEQPMPDGQQEPILRQGRDSNAERFEAYRQGAPDVSENGAKEAARFADDFSITTEGGPSCSSSAAAEVVLLTTVLGKGSFGRVVEGVYQDQRVAVKLMAGGLAPGAVGSERLLRSFTHEVEVLARCCHPNVVRLLAACVSPPSICLVMELMDVSLEQLIQKAPGRLLPMSAVLDIAVDVACGLEYLHPTIVHRDLKPGNVLVNDPLGPNQVAKLSDFGLARLQCTELRTVNPEAGTPAYMAPECFDVTVPAISCQVDIYALGVLLWVMLTGVQPWEGLNFMRLAFKVTYGGERPPLCAIPDDRRQHKLLRLIQSCWESDPRRRPAAAEVAKEIMLVRQIMRQLDKLDRQPNPESIRLCGGRENPPDTGAPSGHSPQPAPPPQFRCMAVFRGLADRGAPRAAEPTSQHQKYMYDNWMMHDRRMYGQRMYEQRMYEQVILQLLTIGRVPRSTLLGRQSSFCSLRSRWQQKQQQALLRAAGPYEDALELCTLDFTANGDQSQELGQQQRSQQRHQRNHHHQQQQQQRPSSRIHAGPHLLASLDSSWRTALSFCFREEPSAAPGSEPLGGTAMKLTIDSYG